MFIYVSAIICLNIGDLESDSEGRLPSDNKPQDKAKDNFK